ncbi:MarR family winged helix-turn-helix transcriptional regulator [Dactylosporangium sp. CA-092794]|uniref:MarR family winged helix-turn-helix transcriptional regulator n=1 Tax=Dactylosporangium sp. CA-092794 TaxID=3239929 RepID=UPI003D91156D
MSDEAEEPGPADTVVFKLGAIGAVATDMLAARIEGDGLKLRHTRLLTALATAGAASQHELAGRLGVAPSLVVSLADHLEALGAIRRVRDTGDRRRQILRLTDRGRELLDKCRATALTVEAELLESLSAAERAALDKALTKLTRAWC